METDPQHSESNVPKPGFRNFFGSIYMGTTHLEEQARARKQIHVLVAVLHAMDR